MLFGAGWKLLSPVYRSGGFFEFTFLTDERFAPFVSWVCGITREQLFENAARISLITTGYTDNMNPKVQELLFTDSVRTLATFTTWWTVGIEAVCAFFFLTPLPQSKVSLRHGTLVLFAVTTYLIAPVPGFGCLLMIMGMAQCCESRPRTYVIYLLLYMFIIVGPRISEISLRCDPVRVNGGTLLRRDRYDREQTLFDKSRQCESRSHPVRTCACLFRCLSDAACVAWFGSCASARRQYGKICQYPGGHAQPTGCNPRKWTERHGTFRSPPIWYRRQRN